MCGDVEQSQCLSCVPLALYMSSAILTRAITCCGIVCRTVRISGRRRHDTVDRSRIGKSVYVEGVHVILCYLSSCQISHTSNSIFNDHRSRSHCKRPTSTLTRVQIFAVVAIALPVGLIIFLRQIKNRRVSLQMQLSLTPLSNMREAYFHRVHPLSNSGIAFPT